MRLYVVNIMMASTLCQTFELHVTRLLQAGSGDDTNSNTTIELDTTNIYTEQTT